MKQFILKVFLFLNILVFSSFAFSETKIAIVNLGKAFAETQFFADQLSSLEANPGYVALNEKIEALDKEIQKFQAEAKANELTWVEARKQEHVQKLQEKFFQLDGLLERRSRAKRELDLQAQKVLIPVAEKIMEVFVRENGITLLVDAASVYSYNGGFDFTEDLIKELNNQYQKPQQPQQ